MNIENIDKVNELFQALKTCEDRLKRLGEKKDFYTTDERDRLVGGHNLCIFAHSDGSGGGVNFSGCYIAEEVTTSIEWILKKKIRSLKAQITELGVSGFEEEPAPYRPSLIKTETIREIFMRHGFTIKEGKTDLKPYVFEAAEELIRVTAEAATSVYKENSDE